MEESYLLEYFPLSKHLDRLHNFFVVMQSLPRSSHYYVLQHYVFGAMINSPQLAVRHRSLHTTSHQKLMCCMMCVRVCVVCVIG